MEVQLQLLVNFSILPATVFMTTFIVYPYSRFAKGSLSVIKLVWRGYIVQSHATRAGARYPSLKSYKDLDHILILHNCIAGHERQS